MAAKHASQSLLIVSCSQRKCTVAGLLPAIERYDGPAYRVLRRYLALHPAELLDIYILSAEYGLFPSRQPIPYYDRRMTPQRARDLRPSVLARLDSIVNAGQYEEIFLCMGQAYLRTLDGSATLLSSRLAARATTGGSGSQLSQLYDWLYGEPPAARGASRSASSHNTIRLRGTDVTLTAQQVLDIARQKLAKAEPGSEQYQSWYVDVDGRRVALKWLVSHLTGLPVSAFVTDEARRVLTQIGIKIERV